MNSAVCPSFTGTSSSGEPEDLPSKPLQSHIPNLGFQRGWRERERVRAGTAAMDAVAAMGMRLDGGRPAPSSGDQFVRAANKAEAAAAANTTLEAAAAKTKTEAAAEGAKKKTKMVPVKQAYIDALLERNPFDPFLDLEQLEKNIRDPVTRDKFRIAVAPAAAALKACRDKEEAIIKQYQTMGYAEMEVEVNDEA